VKEQTMNDDVHTPSALAGGRQAVADADPVAEDVAAALSEMAAGGWTRAVVGRARERFVRELSETDTPADSRRLLHYGFAAYCVPELENMRKSIEGLRRRAQAGSAPPRLTASIEEAERSVEMALAAAKLMGDPLVAAAEFFGNARRAVSEAAAACGIPQEAARTDAV
jgi:hypothetical protein